jgi:hypothetical protein
MGQENVYRQNVAQRSEAAWKIWCDSLAALQQAFDEGTRAIAANEVDVFLLSVTVQRELSHKLVEVSGSLAASGLPSVRKARLQALICIGRSTARFAAVVNRAMQNATLLATVSAPSRFAPAEASTWSLHG